jgi:hypothetical protein
MDERYALAEWVTFILLILLMKQFLMILSFSFCSDAHTTNYPQHFRVDAAEYIMSVFSYVRPLTVCSPLNPQQDFDQN